MTGHAADADDHARVLDGLSVIQQLRADDADVRPLRIFEHGAQPFARDHFRVVVEQDQMLAARVSRAEIVDRRIVERRVVTARNGRAHRAAAALDRRMRGRLRCCRCRCRRSRNSRSRSCRGSSRRRSISNSRLVAERNQDADQRRRRRCGAARDMYSETVRDRGRRIDAAALASIRRARACPLRAFSASSTLEVAVELSVLRQ